MFQALFSLQNHRMGYTFSKCLQFEGKIAEEKQAKKKAGAKVSIFFMIRYEQLNLTKSQQI